MIKIKKPFRKYMYMYLYIYICLFITDRFIHLYYIDLDYFFSLSFIHSFIHLYIYIYIYIYHQHHVVPLARIPLTLSYHFPYPSSPLSCLQSYIPYPHIAAVCMFELVILLLLGHMWGSIGVHHL